MENHTFEVSITNVELNANDAENLTRSELPSLQQYYSGPNWISISADIVCFFGLVAMVYVYYDTVQCVMKQRPPFLRKLTASFLLIYPVSALFIFLAVSVPRISTILDMVLQGIFTVCTYQMFTMLLAYCGGEEEIVHRLREVNITLRTGPCRCCCCCGTLCRPRAVTLGSIRFLHLLILQMPILTWVILIAEFVLATEDAVLFTKAHHYFGIIQLVPMLLGVWGTTMAMDMLHVILPEFRAPAKFLALQLVPIIYTLMNILGTTAASYLNSTMLFTPLVLCRVIANVLTIGALVVLSLWVRHLYHHDIHEVLPMYHTSANEKENWVGMKVPNYLEITSVDQDE